MIGGILQKNYLSAGGNAMPIDSDGVPFDMSHVYASGNIAADMYANVAAESTGRALATRLYEMTDDPGMKDMLSFLIARDAMHQQQWLAAIEDLGGTAALPIPNSFPREQENTDFAYSFLTTGVDGAPVPEGRWSSGPSLDGRSEFRTEPARPLGEEPVLSTPPAETYPQLEQLEGGPGQSPQLENDRPAQRGGGAIDKVKDALS
jgi:Mn-containing catalase